MKTTDLEKKIRSTKRFSEKLVAENPAPTFAEYLSECMSELKVPKKDLIKALNVQRNYGYQMLNGTRVPSRVQIIQIALYLHFSVEQAQKLLNLAGRDSLYVRRPEDARAVHCLEHKTEYKKACDFIWKT